MTDERKPAHQMTSDEIARHVFPPEVHEHLRELANPPEPPKAPKPPARRSRSSRSRPQEDDTP
jgi:hypothetical protein